MKIWHLTKIALLTTVASATAAEPAPPACGDAAFHAFDFWIGDWTVANAESSEASGENRIETIHDGCALRELWSGADGVKGESLTYYDPIDGKWRQRWVSSGYGGYALNLEGTAEEEGRMTLEGAAHFYARAQSVDMRITWRRAGMNALAQVFETRDPQSGEWKTWYHGEYARKETKNSK
ncbi:MAG TPA: hypothetical protein PKM48_09795 [Parvularculaceae bacterium]|nr:hypothetical protein [Parvularculaceae bacterium]